MKKEIFHSKQLNISGKGIIRNAVRGVIIRGSRLLLIYSPVNGDYKFPGGGIKIAETHDTALKREIMEECGAEISKINEISGMITEYSKPREESFDYFAMQSFYYYCELENQTPGRQNLDNYEKKNLS